ncbi:MAG: bifunctional transaldolase/phosoglucose isomerase [Pyrinomonadaceae bacterium]|nr:bifunctional transaldolase/phosoglucose isomerase [Pyrinomonadaceae bacterium]
MKVHPDITNESSAESLGNYDDAVNKTLLEAEQADVVRRIWKKDASLWKTEAVHQKIITNSMGWLTVPAEMLEVADELRKFAEAVRDAAQFEHVMVCGMGGSSLCPEVLRQTFSRQDGFPELLVLDSTDPDAISNLAAEIDLERCLFVIASKSGTTTEPLAFHRYWYHEVAQRSATPGQSFIAITDPGSQMADTARAEGFRQIFLNQSDIGGRYSALSYFGMTPAALMGLDVKRLLKSAASMANACGETMPMHENPGARLGVIMAECARAGRDKLAIVADDKLSAVGLWVEQLIAESTGKEGNGIVPIVGEPLGPVSEYGDDRLFVSLAVGTLDDRTKSQLKALEDAGHPVVYRTLRDLYELCAEFFLWEFATAFAAWRMGINPFDQPNVQESKDATKALLDVFNREGKLPEQSAIASDGTLTVYADDQIGAGVSASASGSVPAIVRQHLARTKPGDYVAVLAYLEETPEIDAAIQAIRHSLREATRCATTTGYGPRFLHSTGQLHKGGPDSGVFIQLTAPDRTDLRVPGESYSFSVLKEAQAQGDFESLLSHGRRAIRVDLGDDVLSGLRKLKELISSVSG